MVFIRRSAGRSGATKVQIAERRSGRNVILEHIGTAHDDAELAVLMQIARERLRPGQDALDLGFGQAPAGPARAPGIITAKRSTLLWNVLSSAYARLGFDAVGDEAFKELVLARLIEPTSKADSVRVLDEIGVPHTGLRTFFRALQRAAERDYRSQIAAACFAHATRHGDVTLLLYDVTTLYFEAEKEDELRKVGYSKERRVDPQIVVGLLVDRAGFPLEIGCWEGNKAETTTILPTIKAFQERHHAADFAIVADAGMLSTSNLKELHAAGMRFIVGSRQTKAPADLASHLRWHSHDGQAMEFTDGQIIDTITPRHKGAKPENDTTKRAEPVWDPKQHPRSWRAIWAYSAKRAARDTRTLAAQEAKARDVVEGKRSARNPRFVTIHKGDAVLDLASLARARQLAGLKGYVTNIPATVIPASEVISSYHDLWHVEQSFRMSKSDLRARPVFHHERDAIEAHLTIVMTALAIARDLQDRTGMSIKKIIRTLRPLQEITVTIAGHEHIATDPITDTAREILTAIDHEH